MGLEFLWYIPNTVESGHRGDFTQDGWGTLDFSSQMALKAEEHGWEGALIGTGWGRPDTFTVSTAVAARTTKFKPLCAVRPGYWRPAHFACAAATLDQLSQGRLLINIVSGQDQFQAYGDTEGDQPARYARTREFMHLVKLLWTQEDVTYRGKYFSVEHSTLRPRPYGADEGKRPLLYFGGASPAAQEVAAAEADVHLMWGEPLAMVEERIDHLRQLSGEAERARPLEFGLRITTLVRDTTEEAWGAAKENLQAWYNRAATRAAARRPEGFKAVGQERLLELSEMGEVLDTCLWTEPGKAGGGGAGTTWLVGSPDDVIDALRAYQALGITHFVLSDTPYLREIERVGDSIISRMREQKTVSV
jgi:alkanesulfonate monooxygenase